MRKELHLEKNWVIVKDLNVFLYETYQEAIELNKVLNGNLMSKTFFETSYKNEHTTYNFIISDDRD
jgi:hypothetical protein